MNNRTTSSPTLPSFSSRDSIWFLHFSNTSDFEIIFFVCLFGHLEDTKSLSMSGLCIIKLSFAKI